MREGRLKLVDARRLGYSRRARARARRGRLCFRRGKSGQRYLFSFEQELFGYGWAPLNMQGWYRGANLENHETDGGYHFNLWAATPAARCALVDRIGDTDLMRDPPGMFVESRDADASARHIDSEWLLRHLAKETKNKVEER